MEALSLRQKVVLARQALHFLRRCQRNDVIPTFITSKKLHETCGLPKDDKKLRGIENDIIFDRSSGECVGERRCPRVTVIGDVALSSDALAALDLGPSFAPSQYLCHSTARRIVGGLQSLHDRLRGRAKIDERGNGRQIVSGPGIPRPPFSSTYRVQQEPNHEIDAKFRIFSTSVLSVLQRCASR